MERQLTPIPEWGQGDAAAAVTLQLLGILKNPSNGYMVTLLVFRATNKTLSSTCILVSRNPDFQTLVCYFFTMCTEIHDETPKFDSLARNLFVCV